MTEQQAAPTPTPPSAPVTTSNGLPPAPAAAPAPAADKQPPWGAPENFNAEEAWKTIQNLRKEKGSPDPQLRSELDTIKQQQQSQRDALAAALGIKPEETSDTEKLTKQLSTLQGQILASERRALAAEHKVPENLLTATDSEQLKAQAVALEEFAKAAHYAATTTPPPPAFQQNPGQGQGNTPVSPEAAAQAEYEKYYPPTPPRR